MFDFNGDFVFYIFSCSWSEVLYLFCYGHFYFFHVVGGFLMVPFVGISSFP